LVDDDSLSYSLWRCLLDSFLAFGIFLDGWDGMGWDGVRVYTTFVSRCFEVWERHSHSVSCRELGWLERFLVGASDEILQRPAHGRILMRVLQAACAQFPQSGCSFNFGAIAGNSKVHSHD
jgi:hypothetical protein